MIGLHDGPSFVTEQELNVRFGQCRLGGVGGDGQAVADQFTGEFRFDGGEALEVEEDFDLLVVGFIGGAAHVDLVRQTDALQTVLGDDAFVFKGIVDITRVEQAEQLDAGAAQEDAGTGAGIKDLGDEDGDAFLAVKIADGGGELAAEDVREDVLLPVVLLGELHQHQGAVAGGVKAGVGEADAHVLAAEDLVPVVLVDLVGIFTVFGVGQGHSVAGKFEIPICVGDVGVGHGGVVHEHGDEGMISADDNVDGFVQFCAMAQHLNAAVKFGVDVHVGVSFFKCGFDLVQGDDEAASSEDGQRGFVLRGAAGQGGGKEDED